METEKFNKQSKYDDSVGR